MDPEGNRLRETERNREGLVNVVKQKRTRKKWRRGQGEGAVQQEETTERDKKETFKNMI